MTAPDGGGDLEGQNQTSKNLMGISGVLKSIGAVSGGVSQYNSYASKAAAEDFNSTVNIQNAASTATQNAINETNLRLFQQRKIGQQRANLSAANIGPISEGSAGEAINQSEVDANMQALTERYRGNVQRTSDLNSAKLNQYYAKVARQNQSTTVSSTAMSATSQLLDGYNRYIKGGF